MFASLCLEATTPMAGLRSLAGALFNRGRNAPATINGLLFIEKAEYWAECLMLVEVIALTQQFGGLPKLGVPFWGSQ